MARFTSMLSALLISGLAALPAAAGDYRSDHGYGYADDVDCYPVTKAYDYHGRPALFGGIQCRDHYGNAWIEPGSRYFIRYLGHYGNYHRLEPVPRDDHY